MTGPEGGGEPVAGGRSRRVYRMLIGLFPAPFRERYGSEMLELFAEELARAGSVGWGSWLGAWVAAFGDVLRRLPREHGRRLRRRNPGEKSVSTLIPDLKFAVRGFVRQPGITFLAVFMLALGIAASTAVFSLVSGLFLRPLPFPEPDRLVYLNETAPRWELEYTGIDYSDFDVWRETARAFEAMALYEGASFNVSDDEGAERLSGAAVTHDFDDVLRLQPALGRMFTAEEDRPGGPRVMVIGYGLWQRRFGGEPAVLGRTLRLNGVEHTIIGVLPAEVAFPDEVDLWVPLAGDPADTDPNYSYEGIGRLKEDVALEQAREDLLRAHAPIWEAEDAERVVSPRIEPLRERLVGGYRLVAAALTAGVALVLLIACANVASVMLARTLARRGEIGVRRATRIDPVRALRIE